jgi:uncharacterized protein (TIGR02145 family)
MKLLRHLHLFAAALLLGTAHAQTTPCPGEPLIFQVEGENHGTKTWEHSTDGVTWTTVEVVENQPFILQPEQSGWYRVRFHDEECDISYVSEPQRYVAHAIELGDALTLSIGGVVRNELGGPVSGATVRAGCGAGVSTTTDHFGVFLLQGIAAYEGLAQVTVEKDGYFTGSRSFIPAENADETISHAYITLLKKNLAGTVQSTSGGQVVLEGVTITFPANGFEQNGQPYTGPVSVYLNHIDPTSPELHVQMPGMLMGVMNDEPQMMLSYGMAGVDLSDAAGQPVQLASGSPATIQFPVMGSQQDDAPESIPLWWFDEDLGYWIQEGEAERIGNEYVGQVAHFSWWNVDVPSNFVVLKCLVKHSGTYAPLPGARVVLSTQTLGTGTTYTNMSGVVVCQVPVGQYLTIDVQLPSGPQGSWMTVHEEVVGPYPQGSVIDIWVNMQDPKLVIGTALDCDGLPVEVGYALVSGVAHFCKDGVFEALTPEQSVTLRVVDLTNWKVSDHGTFEMVNDTTDVGGLIACTSLVGTVTDIEGNSYQTMLIGAQEWMAENLRTGTYANGDPIPNVTAAWTQLTSGAWIYYMNNPSYDTIRGKFYNWYAVADPRKVCPQGWHLPSDAEWQQLEMTLGMSISEADSIGWRGAASNVGGKMKADTLWNSPNTGSTNESGFNGIPGGFHSASGISISLNDMGSWWSNSELNAETVFRRSLSSLEPSIFRATINKMNGLSVRCVRD